MRTRSLCATFVAAACLFASSSALAGDGKGIGVLGDSYSDEYQFYAPHRASARNWVEILAQVRSVNFGDFRTSSWGEPRNQGFAYNWARSGATSRDMIAAGQHTGLANQVAKGEVKIAIVFVGGNDFIEALHTSDPRAALDGLEARAFANVKLAADTLLAASPELKLLVATVPDVRDLPEFRDPLRTGKLDPALAARAAAEIDEFNAKIRRMASRGGRVAIFDFARINRVSHVIAPEFVVVGGRKVERERVGNSPDHLFLGDARHLGTMVQGVMAKLMIDSLNKNCAAGIKPLDEREIVELSDALAARPLASAPKEPRTAGE
jgi:phospholipase/lecithinase/hemolysin